MATDELTRLVAAVERHAPRDGVCDTAVPGLLLARQLTPTDPIALVVDPSLCIVAQGAKEVFLAGEVYRCRGREIVGMATGTVAGRLSRGRALLRARLLRRGIAAPAVVAVVASDAISAVVPPQLAASSVRSAIALVTAGESAAALVSPTGATLMRAVLMKMLVFRVGTTATLVAAATLMLGGAGVIWHRTRAAEVPISAQAGVVPKRFDAATRAQNSTAGKPAIRLPTDSSAVVARMERLVDSGAGPQVVLTVYANGRVVAEIPDGLFSLSATDLTKHAKLEGAAADSDRGPLPQKINKLEGRLSIREVEDLLRFALHDQGFLDLDPAAVKVAIRNTYEADWNVQDANDSTTTNFLIQTADRRHAVAWRRLDKSAWDFPKVEALLQLHALDRRLSRLFYVLLASGPERVDAVATKMEELLLPYYRQYPELPRLTAADLFNVTASADGSRMRFTFSRNKDRSVRNPLFEVSVDVPQQGPPAISYVILPQDGVR